MLKLNRKKLAKDIEGFKKDRLMTFEDMAREVGGDISSSTICRMTRQQTLPDLESMSLICDLIKTDPLDYFDGDTYINLSKLPADKAKKIQAILDEQGRLSIVSETP